jgi:hypothetical protein
MNKLLALVTGFMVAPMVPALTLAAFSPVSGGNLEGVLGGTVIFYFFSFMFTAALGAPAFFLLRRFGLVYWWSCVLGGAAIGALAAVAISPAGNVPGPGLFLFTALGAVAAFVFWSIGGRFAAHPDSDVPAA